MGTLLHDAIQGVRRAMRSLRRRPGFSVATLLTLGLSIGVTTAVALVVHTVVLSDVPYLDPDGIVQIVRRGEQRIETSLTPVDTRRVIDEGGEFLEVGVARFQDEPLTADRDAPPLRARSVVVTGGSLSMLGVEPLLGRLPTAADDVPGGPCVAVLGHELWSDRFGGEPDVLGSSVRLGGDPCTVIGVMPEGFEYPAPYYSGGDLWRLAGPAGVEWTAEAGRRFLVFGRLRAGVSRSVAEQAIATLSPDSDPFVAIEWAGMIRDRSAGRLGLLLAAAALVLLLAAVNVATLQIARTVDREGEISTRLALGASRGGLARLLFSETVVLATGATVIACLTAWWSVELIVALRSFWIPRMDEVRMTLGGGVACAALVWVTALLTTLLPGLGILSGPGGSISVSRSRGGSMGRKGRAIGRALIAFETTLALLLVAGTGLLFRSYAELTALDVGFETRGIMHARIAPGSAGRDAEERVAFYRELEERIAARPEVAGVTLTDLPAGIGAGASESFTLSGEAHAPGAWPRTAWRAVGDRHFDLLGIGRLQGRTPTADGQPREVVVNRTFVDRYLGEGAVLGARLRRVASSRSAEAEAEEWTVIGVVEDVHEGYTFTPPPPTVYAHYRDAPPNSIVILARSTAGPGLAAAEAVRRAAAEIDPTLPVYAVRDLDFLISSEYDLNRLGMTLMAIFAALALVLAVAAVYGVVSHSVGRRMREMGIRVALGAHRGDVLRMTMGEVGVWTGAGGVVGLALVLAAGDVLRALTPTWGGVSLAVLLIATPAVVSVALAAAWGPARRAARVDPISALRGE